jgi:cyclic nucleotide-binding protein
VFAQGNPAMSVMYVQEGGVKISVVGKEAVVAILGLGDFFGEGYLEGYSTCMATATAIVATTVLVTAVRACPSIRVQVRLRLQYQAAAAIWTLSMAVCTR